MHSQLSQFSDIVNEQYRLAQASILEQLDWFIKRGIIEVATGPSIITQDIISCKLNISKTVELKLKDKEYIESLERQLEEQKELIKKLRSSNVQK